MHPKLSDTTNYPKETSYSNIGKVHVATLDFVVIKMLLFLFNLYDAGSIRTLYV